MNKKVLALSVAAMMTMQSAAYAAQDRTEGIGEQAITSAQDNLSHARKQIAALDQSLVQLSQSIETRDQKGRIANAIAVGGAVTGIAILAGGLYATHRGGSEINAVLLRGGITLLAVAATSTATAVSNVVGQVQKSDVDTGKAEIQLQFAQAEIANKLLQTPQSPALIQLNETLQNARASLKDYNTHKTIGTATRLSASGAQLTGAVLTWNGLNAGSGINLIIGPAIMTVGNLMTAVAGYADEDAAAIQKEIQNTRDALAAAQEKLN